MEEQKVQLSLSFKEFDDLVRFLVFAGNQMGYAPSIVDEVLDLHEKYRAARGELDGESE